MTDEEPTRRLRADIERLRDDVGVIHQRIEATALSTSDQFKSILLAISDLGTDAQVKAVIASGEIDRIKSKLCPAVGKCNVLEPRLIALETQFTKMHNAGEQVKGGIKTVRAFWLGCGALLSFGGWIVKDMILHKP